MQMDIDINKHKRQFETEQKFGDKFNATIKEKKSEIIQIENEKLNKSMLGAFDLDTDVIKDDPSKLSQKLIIPKYMIKGNGSCKKNWNLFVITLAIYNSISIPLQLSFEPIFFENATGQLLDSTIDLIFLIDVITNFRTTYLDIENGKEILDKYQIAINYLTGTFAIDVISSLPLDDIFVTGNPKFQSFLQVFGLLKLLRLLKINKFIRDVNSDVETKVGLKIVTVIMTVVLIMHVLACLWFYVARFEEIWRLNMDFIWNPRSLMMEIYFPESVFRQYLLSLYTAFYLFGVGEVCPQSQFEGVLSIFILIIFAIINNTVLSIFAVYAEELGHKDAQLQAKIDLTNTAMSNLMLPKNLRTEVLKYIQNTHNTNIRQEELRLFMDSVSPRFQIICRTKIFESIPENNFILKKNIIPDYINKTQRKNPQMTPNEVKEFAFRQLVAKMEIQLSMPEEQVVTQEDKPWLTSEEEIKMFFIAKGSCEVEVTINYDLQHGSEQESVQKIGLLGEGAHFGEVSLIYGCKRTATVISSNYCTLASLTLKEFKKNNEIFHNFTTNFKNHITKYEDELKMFLEYEMEKIPYWNEIQMQSKQDLIYTMERVEKPDGAMLCASGDKADAIFLIQSGIVEICTTIGTKETPFIIERLERGSIINHRSFMVNDEIDTDYKCVGKVSYFQLPLSQFLKFKDQRSDIKKVFQKVEAEVLLMQNEIALDYIFHNNNHKNYDQQLQHNVLRVKLKNAIVQSWNKNTLNKPINMTDQIERIVEKQRQNQSKGKSAQEIADKEAEETKKKEKEENKRQRQARIAQRKKTEAQDAYLKLHQFDFLYDKLNKIKRWVKGQQDVIDSMENRMLELIKKRVERAYKHEESQSGNQT